MKIIYFIKIWISYSKNFIKNLFFTLRAIIDDNETNLSTDFIDNDNKVDLSISKNENNTQLHDTKGKFFRFFAINFKYLKKTYYS